MHFWSTTRVDTRELGTRTRGHPGAPRSPTTTYECSNTRRIFITIIALAREWASTPSSDAILSETCSIVSRKLIEKPWILWKFWHLRSVVSVFFSTFFYSGQETGKCDGERWTGGRVLLHAFGDGDAVLRCDEHRQGHAAHHGLKLQRNGEQKVEVLSIDAVRHEFRGCLLQVSSTIISERVYRRISCLFCSLLLNRSLFLFQMREERDSPQSRFLHSRESCESRRLRARNLRLATLEEEAGSHCGEVQHGVLPRRKTKTIIFTLNFTF